MSQIQIVSDSFRDTLDRLVESSISGYYNPYNTFKWPENLPEDQWWMSRDLLSVYDTQSIKQLTQLQLKALSKWESINFYSLNIHGIRELLIEVIKRIHTLGFESSSEFFHHFVGEENEHMWLFSTFCLKYGSKIYPNKKIQWEQDTNIEPEIENFLVFSKIFIFEEIVDHFNVRMGKDDSLHPLIQEINNVHHQDESRHIAFGRETIKQLYGQLRECCSSEKLLYVNNYLKRYITASLESLYNPSMYRDAGIDEPYKFRTHVLQDQARKEHHRRFLQRTTNFLTKNNIILGENFI
ncbi:MAG: diiron oxygenase [Symploca sp. SIO1C4]|uniref:Diiron oxygenase n=1 Tax=Symploca sp. SIO1C4 TaxID=2607765 RepID=A0A6B3N6X4_9CYAN|nr:diiron oxygenase [Symploca sp. SIO1C4]